MTLEGFKKYLERKVDFFQKEMEKIEIQDCFDLDEWEKALARITTTKIILETYIQGVLGENEKDA